jgi:hypothetical protein
MVSTAPRLRCDIVIGTRPEAIKLAPVIKVLRDEPRDFVVRVVTPGQHGEICLSALAAFGFAADSSLAIGPIGSSLADSSSGMMRAFGRHIAEARPDLILVQGDTTTAMTAALAGFYAHVPVAHVEAGLRSGDLANPFPEEANRKIIDAVSAILLPPTPQAQNNLVAEGVRADRCPVTGDTVVDALQLLCAVHAPLLDGSGIEEVELEGRRLILVTTHRRESWGSDLTAICSAITHPSRTACGLTRRSSGPSQPQCQRADYRTARRSSAYQAAAPSRLSPVSLADAPRLPDPHGFWRNSGRSAVSRCSRSRSAQDHRAPRSRAGWALSLHRYRPRRYCRARRAVTPRSPCSSPDGDCGQSLRRRSGFLHLVEIANSLVSLELCLATSLAVTSEVGMASRWSRRDWLGWAATASRKVFHRRLRCGLASPRRK